jgi:hypothetical protein
MTIGLALEVGRELDVPLPTAGLAYQLFTEAKALGYGRQDMTAISSYTSRPLTSISSRDSHSRLRKDKAVVHITLKQNVTRSD